MNARVFDVSHCPHPIPDAKAQAYRQAWQYLANPGSWWSGAQRIAIAELARTALECPLCRTSRTALSPFSVTGEHSVPESCQWPTMPRAEMTGHPAEVIEAVHRITNDPARLTGSWVGGLIGEGFSYGHYVELVSVIATVTSIDWFPKVLGLPLEPLPEPCAGDPDGYRPSGARADVAWVPMIYPENLTDRESDIYFGAPKMGNVIRALSLVPEAVRQLHALSAVQYLPTPEVFDPASSGSLSLSRPQIELVAARTSALNDCFY